MKVFVVIEEFNLGDHDDFHVLNAYATLKLAQEAMEVEGKFMLVELDYHQHKENYTITKSPYSFNVKDALSCKYAEIYIRELVVIEKE